MKRFAQLFLELDRTNKTSEKLVALRNYFANAPGDDKIWALAMFTGRRPPRKINSTQVQQWAMELAGIPEWLFRECYGSVGDLAETISLILPQGHPATGKSLSEWFSYLEGLNAADDLMKREIIVNAWKELSQFEIFVFNKLLMGSFRIGVSQTLVVRAIAELLDIDPASVSHRVMGAWKPQDTVFDELLTAHNTADETSRPYPFYLAYAIESDVSVLGDPGEWITEWKWDGIRGQVISRDNELYIWSRGEDLVTPKFPELQDLGALLPGGTVLDGEIICWAGGKPLPFNVLQTRIGRKNVTRKILNDAPVVFIAYDVLEYNGMDIRHTTQAERRSVLEQLHQNTRSPVFKISPVINFTAWDELKELHKQSRDYHAEGFMIKRKDSKYLTGRKKGDWWKWKVDPLSIDAVLIYAQKGHGRRAELFTDYTFGLWHDGKLVPFAKAYSGLTDAEIREVDRFVKQHTLEKFGPVRTVTPELVFEVGFEGINASTRHKAGIAVRFPRILRWRKDKGATEADSLDNLRKILEVYK